MFSFPFSHVHTLTLTDVAEEAVDLSNTCGFSSSFHTRWSKSSESLDLLSEKISGDLAAYHPPNMQICVCLRASCAVITCCVELVSKMFCADANKGVSPKTGRRLGSSAFHFSSFCSLLDVHQPKNGIDETADAFPLRWKTEFYSSVAAAVVFVSVVTSDAATGTEL